MRQRFGMSSSKGFVEYALQRALLLLCPKSTAQSLLLLSRVALEQGGFWDL